MTDNKTNPAVADMMISAINAKYDHIRDLNSIVTTLEECGRSEYVDIIKEMLEAEHRMIGQLQEIVKEVSPEAVEVEVGKEEVEDSLNENFDNVPDDIETVVDIPMKSHNEDHDKFKKDYEDAMEANRETADVKTETEMPKSDSLKKMKLVEDAFDSYAEINSSEAYDACQEYREAVGSAHAIEAITDCMTTDELQDFVEHLIGIYDLTDDYSDVYEKLSEILDLVGARDMYDELIDYLSSDELADCLEHIFRMEDFNCSYLVY